MREPFVDASIILRLLTGDDPEKQQRAKRLFERIERNEMQVTVSTPVLCDVIAVLSAPRFYELPHHEIGALLRPLLRLPGLHLRQRTMVLHALDLYSAHAWTFSEALLAAEMKHAGTTLLYTFESDPAGLEGITQQAPT